MTSIETSVFAKTLHKAHAWLEDLRSALGVGSDQEAYRALRATLHVLRDSLTLQEVGDLSAQLPMLVRGLFLEGWSPGARRRRRLRHDHEFLEAVQERYGAQPIDARRVVTAVFKVLADHVSPGEIEDVKRVLPQPLRGLWPQRGGAVYLDDETQPEGSLGHVVGQYMTWEVLAVSAAAPLQDALETMAHAGVRHLVVLAPEQVRRRPIGVRAVAGMLSNRDALGVLHRHPDEDVRLEWLLVRDVMTHAPLATVTPTADLADAAARMHEDKISALAVVDGDELVGLLTSDDLLYAASMSRAEPPKVSEVNE